MKEKENQQGKDRYLGGKKEECEEEGAWVAGRDKEREGKWKEKREKEGGRGRKCVCVYCTWGIVCLCRAASVPGAKGPVI